MPDQFGLIGMVTAITGFVEIFKDLGLSDATIQQKEITHEKISNLFWINACIGILIMAIVAVLSPVIAWFYGDARLRNISLALSVSFLFSGLSIQHQALLNRQMRFKQLTIIYVLSVFIGSSMGIILAFLGLNYWSLVCKEILTVFIMTSGTWIVCRWVPCMPNRQADIRPMLKFGKDLTYYNIINYFSKSIDKILIGRINGPTSLGLYERASQLMLIPMQQIRFPLARVAIPALSALQNDKKRYNEYYIKLNELLTFFYMPLVIYLGIFSEDIIRIVLGEKWTGAVIIFKILAFASFIGPVSSTCDIVLVTCGMTRKYFLWGLWNSSSMILSYFVGIKWGITGVAIFYAIGRYIVLIPSLLYRLKNTPVSIFTFYRSVYLSVISSLLMGLIVFIIFKYYTMEVGITRVFISFFISAFIYIGIWSLAPIFRDKFREYSTYPKYLINK